MQTVKISAEQIIEILGEKTVRELLQQVKDEEETIG